MSQPTSRNKSLLYPPFALILAKFELALADAGMLFAMFEGLRTYERQEELYAQGRSKLGRIVTNARAGDSWHNYGLAADYVGYERGIWSWDLPKADYKRMADMAVGAGLEAGYYWRVFPDLTHVQTRYGLTLPEAKELYRGGGIKGVWIAIDQIGVGG